MTTKYVLFMPATFGGFNDCLSQIDRAISYCKDHNRVLLLDMVNSVYGINFSEYFNIQNYDLNIIYDTDQIKVILKNNTFTKHPNNIDFNLLDLFDKKIQFQQRPDNSRYGSGFYYKGQPLALPNNDVNEDIIIHKGYGGGNGFVFFQNVFLTEHIKMICNQKIKLLHDNYLCIQVRNADYKCNYQKLYEIHKEKIHSYDKIYICTDDEKVVTFFKSKNLNVYCFTTFPKIQSHNLHRSNVEQHLKIQDLIVDIFIAANSKELLSNSIGGFIELIRTCFHNKECVLNKLK